MNVAEYASKVGVTPRRVRALIQSGAIQAVKSGHGWDIQHTDARRARSRRPLSAHSRRALTKALHQRTLSGLTGQLRARTAARIRMLRESGDPAALLVDWWGGQSPEGINFGANLVAQAQHGDGARVLHRIRTRPAEYLRRRADLADTVSTERTVRGISRTDLAERAAVTVHDLARIETGRPVASVSAVRRVLRALEVEPTAIPAPGEP